MGCGHAANAVDENGRPACAICAGINPGSDALVIPPPDLTGREARCGCGRTEPSSTSLPFFEFRGEGSRLALDRCKHCGYSLVAHTQKQTRTQKNVVERGECPGFEPTGAWEFDSFYDGCRGWD